MAQGVKPDSVERDGLVQNALRPGSEQGTGVKRGCVKSARGGPEFAKHSVAERVAAIFAALADLARPK